MVFRASVYHLCAGDNSGTSCHCYEVHGIKKPESSGDGDPPEVAEHIVYLHASPRGQTPPETPSPTGTYHVVVVEEAEGGHAVVVSVHPHHGFGGCGQGVLQVGFPGFIFIGVGEFLEVHGVILHQTHGSKTEPDRGDGMKDPHLPQ